MLAGVDLQVDIVQYGGVATGYVHMLQVEKVGHALQSKCFQRDCSRRADLGAMERGAAIFGGYLRIEAEQIPP